MLHLKLLNGPRCFCSSTLRCGIILCTRRILSPLSSTKDSTFAGEIGVFMPEVGNILSEFEIVLWGLWIVLFFSGIVLVVCQIVVVLSEIVFVQVVSFMLLLRSKMGFPNPFVCPISLVKTVEGLLIMCSYLFVPVTGGQQLKRCSGGSRCVTELFSHYLYQFMERTRLPICKSVSNYREVYTIN